MSEITIDMLTELHREKEVLKSKVDQAKGRLSAINTQLQQQVLILAKSGVTPETAEIKIREMDESIAETYYKAKTLLEELKNDEGR